MNKSDIRFLIFLGIGAFLVLQFQNCSGREQFANRDTEETNVFQSEAVDVAPEQTITMAIPLEKIRDQLVASNGEENTDVIIEWTHESPNGQVRFIDFFGLALEISSVNPQHEGTFYARLNQGEKSFEFSFKVRVANPVIDSPLKLRYESHYINTNFKSADSQSSDAFTYQEAYAHCLERDKVRNGEGLQCFYGGLLFHSRPNENRRALYQLFVFENGDPRVERSSQNVKRSRALELCETHLDAIDDIGNNAFECHWDGGVILTNNGSQIGSTGQAGSQSGSAQTTGDGGSSSSD